VANGDAYMGDQVVEGARRKMEKVPGVVVRTLAILRLVSVAGCCSAKVMLCMNGSGDC